MDKTNEFLELLASKIPLELINNLYNGTYKYTLTKYRDSMRDVITNYQKKDTCPDIVKFITPDMIDAFLVQKIQTEYYSLVSTRIKEIADIPLVEQKSPEWFRLREDMISASDAGYFLKKCGIGKALNSLRIKVGLKNYANSTAAPLMHGNTYEDVTRAIYESRNQVEVTEYGIISSPTSCIGASPDGVITKCLSPSWECQSRLGRLLEIKNPFSREIDNTIKPEYMVQILQQQYTTQLPICDFVETTIVDKYCGTSAGNYKAYITIDDMLADRLDINQQPASVWQSRIKNRNIPVENLNKFGNEKGIVVWYQKQTTEGDIRNKYILYPLAKPYVKLEIEKWIIDTNSQQFKLGFTFREVKLWRLDVYAEKTVVYDQHLYEGEYIPQLCDVWGVITKCREIQAKARTASAASAASAGSNNWATELENYIEDLENRKDSPFYNENKRKKRMKSTISSASITPTTSTEVMTTDDSMEIELDF